MIDAEELADLRQDFAPARRPKYACADRMCGADDCATCHPFTWHLCDFETQSEEQR